MRPFEGCGGALSTKPLFIESSFWLSVLLNLYPYCPIVRASVPFRLLLMPTSRLRRGVVDNHHTLFTSHNKLPIPRGALSFPSRCRVGQRYWWWQLDSPKLESSNTPSPSHYRGRRTLFLFPKSSRLTLKIPVRPCSPGRKGQRSLRLFGTNSSSVKGAANQQARPRDCQRQPTSQGGLRHSLGACVCVRACWLAWQTNVLSDGRGRRGGLQVAD